ncbi:hypothetical protein MANES_09G019751v8 [Manihot esculenta]|uniref:Uncharacterized protein n=1 Tax=Manihot esculenta TaxID=3983 RepID=A0ACB7H368_MANES|nr:hypothetical protein MANES_09G019751v8 [Manihot esculenta]
MAGHPHFFLYPKRRWLYYSTDFKGPSELSH